MNIRFPHCNWCTPFLTAVLLLLFFAPDREIVNETASTHAAVFESDSEFAVFLPQLETELAEREENDDPEYPGVEAELPFFKLIRSISASRRFLRVPVRKPRLTIAPVGGMVGLSCSVGQWRRRQIAADIHPLHRMLQKVFPVRAGPTEIFILS